MFSLNQFPLFLLRGCTALLSPRLTSSYIYLSLPLPWEPVSGNGEMKRLRDFPKDVAGSLWQSQRTKPCS